MRKKITFLGILLSFLLVSYQDDPSQNALRQVTQQFHLGLEEMTEAIQAYKNTAVGLSDDSLSRQKLQKIHAQTRLGFKKIELFLEYFDHGSIKKMLNGAPLPTVVPKVPEVIPVEPVGLQVLDELAFSETPFEAKAEILRLVAQMETDFAEIKNFQQRQKITHRHVFEAMRQELIRVFTLGLTGFDTPGSGNALSEAYVAMQGVYAAYLPYQDILADKDRGMAIVLDARFQHALEILAKSRDFDTFDRLDFLKNDLNPLYELLLQAHLALGVETIEEVTKAPQPVNYRATNLFANDFLNAGYYANQQLNTPETADKIALGRLLFFDPVLSANNKRACASCHQPEKAFTDGQIKSLAYDGKTYIRRNAPTLQNCVYSVGYFYDLRQSKLERQVLHVVKDSLEFGSDYVAIIQKLNQSPDYQKLFKKAYPTQQSYQISTFTIGDALAMYVASLRSFNSPFDRFVRGDTAYLDPSAYRGFNIFMGKAACGTCHFAPVFNGTVPPVYDDTETEVLGVPLVYDTLNPQIDPDLGRFASGQPRDKAPFFKHAFKTVTVRNVALTAPYMHNGSMSTLEQVVDFYKRGGGAGMGLELSHQTLPFDNLTLNAQEQKDLVMFMRSLTDNSTGHDKPVKLPQFEQNSPLNKRKTGGEY